MVQYLVALFIVLVLVGLFALVLRRITGGRMGLSTADRGRTRQPRLGIVDVYDLDRQRQLVLLRRDNVEHLLLIGGPNDVVVETNIMRVAAGRQPQAAPDGGQAQAPALPERMPSPALEAYAPPPPAERPPQERPQERQPQDRAPNEGPPRPILEPAVGARVNAAEPQAPAVVPGDPMNDIAARVRSLRPEPPLVADAAPAQDPVPPPPRPVPAGATIATPRPPEPRLVEPRPAPPGNGDADVISDMARQLEQAVRRPAPAGAPAPAAAAPPPRMAPPRPPEPPRQAPPVPRPVQPPEAPARAAPPPPPPPPAPGPGKVDPFSVDEIEAEFARLLGRSPDKT
ncbi:hypothetical protein F0L46_22590 [Salinarimonas soli]|uniref:Flagellar biosynthesis protein FliO n=1 Tax=Salinarimonas soli TaxID=1638099 RepID=A0A5B2V7A0_9HYPH|nr:hypothetical protein F0L46_22590 [Salinarimonas soli]